MYSGTSLLLKTLVTTIWVPRWVPKGLIITVTDFRMEVTVQQGNHKTQVPNDMKFQHRSDLVPFRAEPNTFVHVQILMKYHSIFNKDSLWSCCLDSYCCIKPCNSACLSTRFSRSSIKVAT